ncbi:MAG: NUDIX domain-containing protein, partial [Candidatus Rokuibacteriota bacterium]
LEGCLRRELREELGAAFDVGEKADTIRWEYPDRTVVLHFFRCRLETGTIVPREGQAMRWVATEELPRYSFPPADRELIGKLHAGRRG